MVKTTTQVKPDRDADLCQLNNALGNVNKIIVVSEKII